MKIRSDFVTNSSSSSFILAFKDKEDGFAQISNLLKDNDSSAIGYLLKDFNCEDPIPCDELYDRIKDDLENEASTEMWFGDNNGWYSRKKDTFEHRWFKAHPGAKYSDYYNSIEYKEEIDRRVKEKYVGICSKLDQNSYIVELEYEDHNTIESMLEQEILPECDFTVYTFNHH